MAGFVKCPECKYLVIDLRAPCPSCGAYVPAPAQVAPPVEPIPYHEQTQHHDDSRKGPSKKTIAIMLCAVILVVAGGAGLFYYIRQQRAALEAERAAQERIEQQRAAMIEQERLAEERAREEQLAAARENTFSFPNGISFSYPSGFEVTELDLDELGIGGLVAGHSVMLTRMSEGPLGFSIPSKMITVSLSENMEGLTISDLYQSQRLFEEHLPEELMYMVPQMTKTTISGNEALVGEASIEGSFSRFASILSGNNFVVVHGIAFGDESMIDEFRAIAEGIENSLIFVDMPVSVASAESTFSFPNGISFSYPSEFEVNGFFEEFDELFLGLSEHTVTLATMANFMGVRIPRMKFTVSLEENTEGLTISDLYAYMSQSLFDDEYISEELKEFIRSSTPQMTKTTIAGREALVGETGGDGYEAGDLLLADILHRQVIILFDNYLVHISGAVFPPPSLILTGRIDASRIDEFRAIAEGIENSLTFGE